MIDLNVPIAQLADRASQQFERQFGRPARWFVAAPGRVNLIGEHTDYNDGFVLPMAIERYVVLAADRSPVGGVTDVAPAYRICSTANGQCLSWPASGPTAEQRNGWTSYVWGVLQLAGQQGMDTGPVDVAIHSSIPLGGGLSSSAALEVATATLVEAITGQSMGRVEKALLCQKAEHEYAGVPCGIMDQFSSVMGRSGHLILLDCRSAEAELVPLESDEIAILIANTNVKHELTGGEYAERRSQCEAAAAALGLPSLRDCTMKQLEQDGHLLDDVTRRRSRHVVSEIDRTVRAASIIQAGDWSEFGRLMYASHDSLRDDYEVSCEELDLMVDLARELNVPAGVYGSRMTGGGFGGCTVSLVQADKTAQIARSLAEGYVQKTGIEPTIFVSRPARGAHRVERNGESG